MEKGQQKILERVSVSRRDAVRKIVLGTAFAVPTIASFSLDGMVLSKARAGDSSNFS